MARHFCWPAGLKQGGSITLVNKMVWSNVSSALADNNDMSLSLETQLGVSRNVDRLIVDVKLCCWLAHDQLMRPECLTLVVDSVHKT